MVSHLGQRRGGRFSAGAGVAEDVLSRLYVRHPLAGCRDQPGEEDETAHRGEVRDERESDARHRVADDDGSLRPELPGLPRWAVEDSNLQPWD
jgi:hypothetical protein